MSEGKKDGNKIINSQEKVREIRAEKIGLKINATIEGYDEARKTGQNPDLPSGEKIFRRAEKCRLLARKKEGLTPEEKEWLEETKRNLKEGPRETGNLFGKLLALLIQLDIIDEVE